MKREIYGTILFGKFNDESTNYSRNVLVVPGNLQGNYGKFNQKVYLYFRNQNVVNPKLYNIDATIDDLDSVYIRSKSPGKYRFIDITRNLYVDVDYQCIKIQRFRNTNPAVSNNNNGGGSINLLGDRVFTVDEVDSDEENTDPVGDQCGSPQIVGYLIGGYTNTNDYITMNSDGNYNITFTTINNLNQCAQILATGSTGSTSGEVYTFEIDSEDDITINNMFIQLNAHITIENMGVTALHDIVITVNAVNISSGVTTAILTQLYNIYNNVYNEIYLNISNIILQGDKFKLQINISGLSSEIIAILKERTITISRFLQ